MSVLTALKEFTCLHKIYSIPIIDKEIWAWQEQTKPCITRRWLPYRHHDYVPVKRLDHKLFNIASTYVYIISKTSYIKFGNLVQVPQDIYPNLAQESLITGPVLLWKTSSVFPCYLVSSLLYCLHGNQWDQMMHNGTLISPVSKAMFTNIQDNQQKIFNYKTRHNDQEIPVGMIMIRLLHVGEHFWGYFDWSLGSLLFWLVYLELTLMGNRGPNTTFQTIAESIGSVNLMGHHSHG